MQTNHNAILEKVVLVAAPLNLFSPERDMGSRKKNDLVVEKQTIQYIPTSLLAPFRRKRSELRRMLVNMGTKVPLFNAYAIPAESAKTATIALGSFLDDWNRLLADFKANYSSEVQKLKAEHPGQAAEISRHAPELSELMKKMEFRFTIYEVTAGAIHAEGGLANELLSLPEKVMHDIATELGERAGQGQLFRQGIREVLGRVRAKAEGFAFLHPVIASIPEAIDKTLANLPTTGAIQGADGLLLGGLIGALQNKRILEIGVVMQIDDGASPETHKVEDAKIEMDAANDSAPAIPVALTGTWDF